MENKLQELTEKIYSEGVSKANEEAKQIKQKAEKEAEEIKNQAQKEADEIVNKAKKEAEEIKKNLDSELRLSANQAVTALKQKITDLITAKVIDEPVEKVFKDKDFVQEIIETAIKNWDPSKTGQLNVAVMLPKEDENKLGKYFTAKENEYMQKGLEVKFDQRMKSGFKIGPKDGSFKISFTDQDFENFFKAYLRPRTNQLLYGEKQ
ncbi:MAG: V-type ATP synthase subunit E [Bacteroidales bacterium]|nr:V-type ATP synthase subunit E [Bacteroidales bacterium]